MVTTLRTWLGNTGYAIVILLAVTTAEKQKPCITQGHIFTQLPWYGYIAQKTLQHKSAKIRYQFAFPIHASPKILIYHDDQIRKLKEGMTCEERERVLPDNNSQIIPLIPNKTAGCKVQTGNDDPVVICVGERDFSSSSPKIWYFVISRCKDKRLLSFWYYFNMTGYFGECEADPLAKTYVPPPRFEEHQYIKVIIALGIIGGVAFISTCLFVYLWWKTRGIDRCKDKSNDSLTSSQATMTQDIFFVNTTMPTERDTSDYSRSSSENYYEVIPDRRSYDGSDTTRFTVGGRPIRGPYASRSVVRPNDGRVLYQAGPGNNLTLPTSTRDTFLINSNRHTPQTFLPVQHFTEDYPPPPYHRQRLVRTSYPSQHHSQHVIPEQQQTLLSPVTLSPNITPHTHTQC